MENRHDFDALARELAHGLSRREALRRLCGGFAGAVLASLGADRAWGAPNACSTYCNTLPSFQRKNCNNACKQCGGHVRNVCPSLDSDKVACCNQGTGCCSGACTPLGTAQNCTACGDVCPGLEVCVSATAGCQCPSGSTPCGATCCPSDQTCCGSTCCSPGQACNGSTCATASTCSGDECSGTVLGPCSTTSPNCFCYVTTEGGHVCLNGAAADCAPMGTPCTSTSDCPTGSFCAGAACCGGQATCIPAC